MVTTEGHIEYRDVGVGDGSMLNVLAPGQTQTVRGWSITDSEDGVSLIDTGTGHGMKIHDDGTVDPTSPGRQSGISPGARLVLARKIFRLAGAASSSTESHHH